MRVWIGLALLVAVADGHVVRGDDVGLKNGNLVSGTISRVGPDVVELKTDFAGVLRLPRDTVKFLRSDAKVPVSGTDGAVHETFVAPSEDWGGWHEASEATRPVAKLPQLPPTTTSLSLPRQSGQVVLAYLGSSTWALNQGSGQVPLLIDRRIRAEAVGASLVTVNGSIGGTRTGDYLPGKPNHEKLKAAVQKEQGFKVLRMMIGSNDAAAAMPTADWEKNMHLLIDDAMTWPVDLIILEEIGVRTDKGDAGIALIRQYNEARASFSGPKIVLGSAHALQNQADHLDTLSRDHIHQVDAGQQLLAATQAAEVMALFVDAAPATRPAPVH